MSQSLLFAEPGDPPGGFVTLTLDPPWKEEGGCGRGTGNKYPTIKDMATMLQVVIDSGFPDRMAADAHCYLWTTTTSLKDGIWLLEQLGFEYKTFIVWVKVGREWPRWFVKKVIDAAGWEDHERRAKALTEALSPKVQLRALKGSLSIGMGQYFRAATEICLFGTRGQGFAARTRARDIPSVLFATKGRHSEKPEAFFDLVERRSAGPYVELFARAERDGWVCWGNEVPARDDAPPGARSPTSTGGRP